MQSGEVEQKRVGECSDEKGLNHYQKTKVGRASIFSLNLECSILILETSFEHNVSQYFTEIIFYVNTSFCPLSNTIAEGRSGKPEYVSLIKTIETRNMITSVNIIKLYLTFTGLQLSWQRISPAMQETPV